MSSCQRKFVSGVLDIRYTVPQPRPLLPPQPGARLPRPQPREHPRPQPREHPLLRLLPRGAPLRRPAAAGEQLTSTPHTLESLLVYAVFAMDYYPVLMGRCVFTRTRVCQVCARRASAHDRVRMETNVSR